jgi:hypothetical protein
VPGDDPSVIASGPTVPDPTTFADARDVIARYAIDIPDPVRHHLAAAADETPKPGDRRLAVSRVEMVATPQDALEAAAAVARAAGVTPLILGNAIEGEASDVALVHAGIARQALAFGQPVAPPAVVLSGGETTVTVRGKGRGGRNGEFLLALAVALDGLPQVWALAADTDGIDGIENNAGAILRPDTLGRARALGLDAKARLADNDGYGFFAALDDLIITGPTRTNVNDFRAIIVGRPGACGGGPAPGRPLPVPSSAGVLAGKGPGRRLTLPIAECRDQAVADHRVDFGHLRVVEIVAIAAHLGPTHLERFRIALIAGSEPAAAQPEHLSRLQPPHVVDGSEGDRLANLLLRSRRRHELDNPPQRSGGIEPHVLVADGEQIADPIPVASPDVHEVDDARKPCRRLCDEIKNGNIRPVLRIVVQYFLSWAHAVFPLEILRYGNIARVTQ